MKITLKLIISLVLASTMVISVFTYLQVRYERARLSRELDVRAEILGESLQESIKELLKANSAVRLKSLFEKFGGRDRLVGVALYDSLGNLVVSSINPSIKLQDSVTHISESFRSIKSKSTFAVINGKSMHLYTTPLLLEDKTIGSLLILYDTSFIDSRINNIWQTNFVHLLIQTILIIITTVLIVRSSVAWPIVKFTEWIKGLRTGKIVHEVELNKGNILKPLTEEVKLLAKSLAVAKENAEGEGRLLLQAEYVWTAERLKKYINQELNDRSLIIVSNREPYTHRREGSLVKCIVPAGGLVTALDPILRVCGGTWLAHGSGDADPEMSDENGRLSVPPEEPSYILRRIFLSKEEEEGYYYGFSNEGIWPLCHITHTRPTFRLDDWITYQQVNQKFADAIIEEIKDKNEPLIFIQDYHFALLPFLIKSKRPDAHVALFWHIPWPNPEVFGICPWKKEILIGLLGADLVGFHTQFYCNNFLETIDRFLESKINWDQFNVERLGGVTAVKPFPISIAFSDLQTELSNNIQSRAVYTKQIFKKIGFRSKYLGVGVDRIDYTKGIAERFLAVERFLQKYPDYIGQFTYIGIGAPSRTHIKRYHDLAAELDETVDKINWRFQSKGWRPIVFLKVHHSHKEISNYYKAADVCMVTSLHDGMNLVAKEFVASRDDNDGVLILSQFTGASRELQDSILVNPYSIEEVADSIYMALNMSSEERFERMTRMRTVLKERNVYRWAARIITELSRLRIALNTGT